MYEIALESYRLSFEDLINNSIDNRKKIEENEDLIDQLNDGIIKHITKYLPHESNIHTGKKYGSYITISSNVERISDHTMNLSDETLHVVDNDLKFSATVYEEINEIKAVLDNMVNLVFEKGTLEQVKAYENKVDELTEKFRGNMLARLSNHTCTSDGSVSYSTLLIDLERIGDHLLNIAEQYQRV